MTLEELLRRFNLPSPIDSLRRTGRDVVDVAEGTYNAVTRGVPQQATGFVDLAALPFTMSGLLDEKNVVGGTKYLTQRGLLPPPQKGLLNETAELVSSALNPAGAVKGGLLALGTMAGFKGAKGVNEIFKNIDAGDVVSGLTVRKDVPNMSSIGASLDNYEILSGIKSVPRNAFDSDYLQTLDQSKLDARTANLSKAINESKEINPLIVAVDDKGAYIIEGGHRFDALMSQQRKNIPAVVVVDKDNPPTQEFLKMLMETEQF